MLSDLEATFNCHRLGIEKISNLLIIYFYHAECNLRGGKNRIHKVTKLLVQHVLKPQVFSLPFVFSLFFDKDNFQYPLK